MDDNFKKNIQEAIKAELQKEGVFDVGRAAMGHMRLSGINKQLKKSGQKIEKEWGKAKKVAEKKAAKMSKSKYGPVAQHGNQVTKNISALDQAMASALKNLGNISSMGAQDPEAISFNQGYEAWLRHLGIDPIRLAKGPGNEYGRVSNEYRVLLSLGIDPMKIDYKDFDKEIQKHLTQESDNPLADWIKTLKRLGREPEAQKLEAELGHENIANAGNASSTPGKQKPGRRNQNQRAAEPPEWVDQFDRDEAQNAKAPVASQAQPGLSSTLPSPQIPEPSTEEAFDVPNVSTDELKEKGLDFLAGKIGKWASNKVGLGDEGTKIAADVAKYAFDKFVKNHRSAFRSPEQKAKAIEKAQEVARRAAEEALKNKEISRQFSQSQSRREKKRSEEAQKNQRFNDVDMALQKKQNQRMRPMNDYAQKQEPEMSIRSSGDKQSLPQMELPPTRVAGQISPTIPHPPPSNPGQQRVSSPTIPASAPNNPPEEGSVPPRMADFFGFAPNGEVEERETAPFDLKRKKNMTPEETDQRFEDLQSDEDLDALKNDQPKMSDFFDVDKNGKVEEKQPAPLKPKKPRPGMEISKIASSLAKKPVSSHINDKGERQVGIAPSESPTGEGESGTFQAQDKTYKPKKKKKSSPSARRKK